MADATETQAQGDSGSTNGVSASRGAALDATRAAFLAGESAEESTSDDGKVEKSAPVADDDSDLDEETVDSDESDEDEESEAVEDEDSDLDEDEDEKPAGKVDSETSKRLEQVRRTDKRLREQREKDWAARDADFDARVKSIESQWGPRVQVAEEFERIRARAAANPIAAIKALGVPPEKYAYFAQAVHTFALGKDDPKAALAAQQLIRDQEVGEEIAELKKWRDDREQTDKQREQAAAQERELDAYFDGVTKAASDKTPLAKKYIETNPKRARADMAAVAHRLSESSGTLPTAKAVMIAFEKERRQILRDHGVDPKSVGAATSAANTNSAKTAKPVDKKTAAKSKAKPDADDADDNKPFTREDFMSFNGS